MVQGYSHAGAFGSECSAGSSCAPLGPGRVGGLAVSPLAAGDALAYHPAVEPGCNRYSGPEKALWASPDDGQAIPLVEATGPGEKTTCQGRQVGSAPRCDRAHSYLG